jgi:hypothetical protein
MAWTSPKTWTVGEVLTAADMNEQVRDNMNALRQVDIQSASGFNPGGFAYATMASTVLDDLGGWAAGAGAYWTAPWAGRFEVTVMGVWTGATGSSNPGLLVAAERWDSGGVANIETIAMASTAYINGAIVVSGLGVFTAGQRLKIGASNAATGTAGVIALRSSIIARG